MTTQNQLLREAFEAYFLESRKSKGRNRRPTFERFDDGTYKDDHTQRHWWTWQQARTTPPASQEQADAATSAGTQAAIGHLSRLVDEATSLISQLRTMVDDMHEQWSIGGVPERGEFPLLDRVDDWLSARPSQEQAQQPSGPHLFEFWWEAHMPQATQAEAWAAWQAAHSSKGVGIEQQPKPQPMTDEMPPDGMKWFYCTTNVKNVSGHQLWRVAARSLEHAMERFDDGHGDIVSEEVEVTDLDEPEWERISEPAHHGITSDKVAQS